MLLFKIKKFKKTKNRFRAYPTRQAVQTTGSTALDEFTFRFNRRTSAHRGKLFYRLIENAVKVEPVPLNSLKGPNQNDKDENFDDIYSGHNM